LEAVTKTLKLQAVSKTSTARKLTISTNWLNVFGLTKGTPVIETVLGNGAGMTVEVANEHSEKTKLVYSRGYKTREDETLVDIRSQKVIKPAFSDATHAHIIFQHKKLTISPVYAPEARAKDTGLNLTLGENGISFTAIITALNYIKEHAFAELNLTIGDDYKETQEYILFAMQIRRMGYKLGIMDNGLVKAVLGAGGVSSVIDYKLPAVEKLKELVFDYDNPLATISACTAGVDISGIEDDGFSVLSILEHRPSESRDFKKTTCALIGEIRKTLTTDKTETGAICAAVNSKAPKVVYNEDVYTFDSARVKPISKSHNVLQVSPTCTEFSNLKNKKDKKAAIETLSSSRDMIFPIMGLIEDENIPCTLLENVKNFSSSHEAALFTGRLEERGYKVYSKVLNAADFNGYTMRERCFIFATRLDAKFEWPEAVTRTVHLWNDLISKQLHRLRNITHTKTLKKAITTGRLRAVSEGAEIGQILTKSQNRQVKDSLYCEINQQYYMPDNELMKMMMGIKPEFDLSLFSNEIGSEIVGQAVDISMHHHIAMSVKEHILRFAGGLKQGNNQLALF
jgi:site-specific DNA-cytosine methylase